MPLPDRPASGETIAAEWGAEIHDRVFAAPGCLCTGGAVTVTTAGQQLPIDTATDDPGGLVDIANNRIELVQAGIYLIVAELGAITGAADSETRGMIFRNGTQIASGLEQNEGGVGVAWTVTAVADCTAGDLITVSAILKHDAGADPSVNIRSLNVLFMTDERGA